MNSIKFIFFITLLIHSLAFSQHLEIVNFNRKDYDAHFQNWAVIQSKTGKIYIGNHIGLLIYNSRKWDYLGIPNYTIRSLAKDKSDRIYVGGVNTFGYIKNTKIGTLKYFDLSKKLPVSKQNFKEIWNIHVLDNSIYFNSFKTLFKWNGNELKDLTIGKILYTFKVNGRLYVQGFNNFELYYLKNDSLKQVSNGEFNKKYIVSMNAFNKGILISTYKGVLFYMKGSEITSFNSTIESKLKSYYISDVRVLNNQTILFGTKKNGLIVYNKEINKHQSINVSSGLQNDDVKSIFQANDKSIWLGLNNGVSKFFIQSSLTKFTKKEGLKLPINDILMSNSELYIADDNGLSSLSLLRDEKIIRMNQLTNRVSHLLKYKNKLYISGSGGLFLLKNNKIKRLKKEKVSFTYFSKFNSNYFFYKIKEGLFLEERNFSGDKKSKLVYKFQGEINTIAETDTGIIWVGTNNSGVLRINYKNTNDVKVKQYLNIQGKKINLASVYLINNEMFLTSSKLGVYRLNPDKEIFERENRFGSQFSDGSRSVLHLKSDDKGNIYFTSKLRLYKAEKQDDGSFKLNSRIFNKIPTVQTTAIYPDSNGIVWIANEEGIYRYDSKVKKDINRSFNVNISRLILNQDSVLFGGFHPFNAEKLSSTINYAKQQLRFEFAAAYYEMPEKTRYSYKLDGYDADWSPWSDEAFKDYTGLYEGDYTFHVRAMNVYETIGQTASYSFRILAPWYRTWWAYIVYIIFTLTLLTGLIYYLSRRKLKRFEELRRIEIAEAKAREALLKNKIEKEEIRSRIARDLHDEIGTNLSYIKLKSELSQMKIPDTAVKNLLSEIMNIANDSAVSMRDIVWFINPENESFEAFISKITETFYQLMSPYNVSLDNRIKHDFLLSIDQKRNIFLIFKEALQNIIKHAEADKVELLLYLEEESLNLKIRDNGIGFDSSLASKGNGIKNYYKRAGTIKAGIKINSEPGNGTEIHIKTN